MTENGRIWWEAARPRTLPAAVVPVAVGTALAFHAGVAAVIPALLCLAFALLLQVGTNFANDYFDFVKGADTPDRIGPPRAVASGWVPPETMRRAMLAVFAAAFLVGLPLVYFGGPWLLVVGALSLLFGYAYTGGPYPLAYHGLGDVFVFIFFGLVATAGTFFVQAGGFLAADGSCYLAPALLAGVVPGALAVNLLVVNNLRDVRTDAAASKRTLIVRYGVNFARLEYAAMGFAALIAAVSLAAILEAWPVFAVFGLYIWQRRLMGALIFASRNEHWGPMLAGTAAYLMVFGAALSGALVVARFVS